MRRISAVQGYLIDANLWVAATFERHPHHGLVNGFFSQHTSPEQPAHLCRATEQSWLRLITTSALQRNYDSPVISNRDAVNLFEKTVALPNVSWTAAEPEGLGTLWHHLASLPTASPKVWMDAYLAAFAIGHDLEFVTLDGDFKRFVKDGLKLKLLTP